jgi:TonB family protein
MRNVSSICLGLLGFLAVSASAQNRIGAGVSAPVLIQKVEPRYSRLALKAKVQDGLLLSVEVSEDGRAHNIKIARPSIDPELDRQGILAVEQWRFQPGMRDGKPVNVFSQIEVHFRLLNRSGSPDALETDYKSAVKVYKPEAAKGNADAQYSMGAIFYHDKEFTEARQWFEKAAAHGICQAEYQLGVMARKGEGGAADEQEARRWFEKSAAHSNYREGIMVYTPPKTGQPQ